MEELNMTEFVIALVVLAIVIIATGVKTVPQGSNLLSNALDDTAKHLAPG